VLRLAKELWQAGTNCCFVFDTTYCKVRCDFKIGILSYVSSDGRTVPIFFSLLHQQTTDDFEWVFEQFILSFGPGSPGSVIFTDEDAAIRSALRTVHGQSLTHYLCAFHLSLNWDKKMKAFTRSLGAAKISSFTTRFWKLMKDGDTRLLECAAGAALSIIDQHIADFARDVLTAIGFDNLAIEACE
jgi:hypothetical protein